MFRNHRLHPMISFCSPHYRILIQDMEEAMVTLAEELCNESESFSIIHLNPPISKEVKTLRQQHIVRSPGGNKTRRLRRS